MRPEFPAWIIIVFWLLVAWAISYMLGFSVLGLIEDIGHAMRHAHDASVQARQNG